MVGFVFFGFVEAGAGSVVSFYPNNGFNPFGEHGVVKMDGAVHGTMIG